MGNPSASVASVNHILIYRCGTIGDTIVALPAISGVRRKYPNAKLTLMTATGEGKLWADDVVRDFGWFDDYIVYPEGKIGSVSVFFPLLKRVRQAGADIVLDLGSDKNSGLRNFRDRLFFLAAGIRRFVPAPSEKVSFFGKLNRSVREYDREVDRFLKAVKEHAEPASRVAFDLPVGVAERERVDALLGEEQSASDGFLVGMCPGSKQQAKRWPLNRYQELGAQIIAVGGKVVIVGGADEAAIARRIGAYWPAGSWINLAGQLSVLESAEVLRRCRFYVGNDTGPMHLAAAMDTPCVALFSAREPVGSWYPYGDQHVVFRKSVPCANCYLSACYKNQVRCMTDIQVDEVWSACARFVPAA